MGSIFSRFKDALLELVEAKGTSNLKFPHKKLRGVLNNYTRGDFIVVGGRKTSGKSSFILNNYVISPLVQKISAKKNNTPFDVKIIYISTRKNIKTTIERMVVNFNANKNSGTKIGVPTLYGFEGSHAKASVELSKSIVSTTLTTLDGLVDKGLLTVSCTSKTLNEIEVIIRSSMEEYGSYDVESRTFTYEKKYEDMIPIITIDDSTGINTDVGERSVRTENGHQIGSRLRELAKIYNVVLVLAVPSYTGFFKRRRGKLKGVEETHSSTLDEVAPYHIYADRVIIMHNPMETEDSVMLGYETAEFINNRTGVNYLRTAFVAANYMGPSGIYLGLFVYPENGYMVELPSSDADEELDAFKDIVNS